MTKWPVQKLAQGTTQKLLQHHDATDISKCLFRHDVVRVLCRSVLVFVRAILSRCP